MKILSSLYSFFKEIISAKKEGTESFQQIIIQVFEKLNKVLTAIFLAIIGFSFFIIGFVTLYFNLLSQYDSKGFILLNATNIGAIVLSLLGVAIAYSARIKDMSKFEFKNVNSKSSAPSVIEQAVATLILDYVKEREHERENSKNHHPFEHTNQENSENKIQQ